MLVGTVLGWQLCSYRPWSVCMRDFPQPALDRQFGRLRADQWWLTWNRSMDRCTSASAAWRLTQSPAWTYFPGSKSL